MPKGASVPNDRARLDQHYCRSGTSRPRRVLGQDRAADRCESHLTDRQHEYGGRTDDEEVRKVEAVMAEGNEINCAADTSRGRPGMHSQSVEQIAAHPPIISAASVSGFHLPGA